jgi:aminopeptidase N
MLESYLGPQTFRAGVNLYLKEHAYGNATAADFWGAMARASHKPIDQIMPTFVMQAGAPYVDVATKCEGNNTSLKLSQKRFFDDPALFNRASDQLWQIPVCAKGINGTTAGKQECFLLTQREQEFKLKGCSQFVFPDANALGYYRFSYDNAALREMGSGVEKTLTPEERIALIGNEWALMRIGKHNVGDYLALGAQLKNTPGAVLLDGFGDHLEFINERLLTDADRPAFQAWLRAQFSPVLQQLGYSGRSTDTPEDKQKRALLFEGLGNVGQDPQVIQQAQTMVQQLMNDPSSIDGTLAPAVVVVAARHGNAELYDQFKAQLQKASSPQRYYMFARALGQFPEDALIQRTLATTLTPAVRGQDLYMLLPMMGNPVTQNATWDFMRKNFDQLYAKAGGGLGGVGVFLYGTAAFCSTEKAQEVKQFFQQHSFPGTERNQKEALESIQSCVDLRNQQEGNLAAWLKQQGSSTNAGANSSGGGASSGSTMR